MLLASWNVNGIRAILQKNFFEFLADASPDILCVQETKARPEQVDLHLSDYHAYWNAAERPGYSGTAVFTRIHPNAVHHGMGLEEHDREGRVLTLEFDDWILVNVYTPNSGRDLERLQYRYREWDPAFLAYVNGLQNRKPVIFCGDLNVAHREIDLHDPSGNRGNAGFTDEEREGFDRILQAGYLDAFREFCDEGGRYTWWSYVTRARSRNAGWRIDYFCVSPQLRSRLCDASILDNVMGSDHCPVTIELTAG